VRLVGWHQTSETVEVEHEVELVADRDPSLPVTGIARGLLPEHADVLRE
jgi:hypothetical protein